MNASLVNSCHNSPRKWSRRQRRFYHRAMSGIELAHCQGIQLRILCLTSSPASTDPKRAFQLFVKRVRRRYGVFEYIVARELTESGLVHFHIIYKGVYIPQKWLSKVWNELNNAKIVYIQKFRGSKRRLGAYLVKYLRKELVGSRSWWSWGWVFRGFVRFWKYLVKTYRANALKIWRVFLRAHALCYAVELPSVWSAPSVQTYILKSTRSSLNTSYKSQRWTR